MDACSSLTFYQSDSSDDSDDSDDESTTSESSVQPSQVTSWASSHDLCEPVTWSRPSSALSECSLLLDPEPFMKSWQLSESGEHLQLRTAQLLWNHREHSHVWDVDFLPDGAMVFISGADVSRQGAVMTFTSKSLHRLTLTGEALTVPFPENFVDPAGVAVSRTSGAVAITDRSPEGSSVMVMKKCDEHWEYQRHTTHSAAMRVALNPQDVAACAVRWEKLVKLRHGRPVLSRSITATNSLSPYVAVSSDGHVVASTPASNRVIVHDARGRLVSVFPPYFITKPTGVTVDGTGRVLLADRARRSVSQFSLQGHFIQKICSLDAEPQAISVYQDRYLAVATFFSGLYLYRLDWA